MSLVTLPPVNNGDEADESLFNSRWGAIADVLNGNIDSDNLSANAVTTPKINNLAVTEAKLDSKAVTGTKLQMPFAMFGQGGDSVYAGNVWRRGIMDTMITNVGGFSIENQGIKVPFTGVYEATAHLCIQDRSNLDFQILENMTTDGNGPSGRHLRFNTRTNPSSATVVDFFSLAAGNILYFWHYVEGGTNYRYRAWNTGAGDVSWYSLKLLAYTGT